LKTESLNNIKLTYFPNPVKDIFSISLQNEIITQIIISNSIGQLMNTKTNIYNNKYSLDFQDYPNGIYLVSIYTGENMKTIKVIKQ
jgi:hypothetical protein